MPGSAIILPPVATSYLRRVSNCLLREPFASRKYTSYNSSQTRAAMAATDSRATSSKLASYLSRLSPIPAFPRYTGPYKVGTVDVEIPVSDLKSPSPAPEHAADISTVQFRVFYPAVTESNEKPITWLPNPQRHHVSAYTKFVGLGSTLSDIIS